MGIFIFKIMELYFYKALLEDIKQRISIAQVKATLSVNAQMIALYAEIGEIIHKRQQDEGWSARIIPTLAKDLRNELPELKGFSERNLGYMLRFAKEYSILQQPVAKLNYHALLGAIPWGHNIILMEKVK